MINNYPLIFKQRAVEYFFTYESRISDILKIFNISRKTFYNWRIDHLNNSLQDKQIYFHKNKKIYPQIMLYVRNKVVKLGIVDRYIIIKNIYKKFKIKISVQSIYDILSKMNITVKKIKKRFIYCNKKKHKQNIKEFKRKIKNKSRRKIISIDEFSIDTHIIREYQWSKKGEKIEKYFKVIKKRFTVTCAISNNKIIYYSFVNGSSNAPNFKIFLRDLINTIGNNYNKYYYLLDNASIHHAKIIKEYINLKNINFIYNAPYSPEYNPIEKAFSVIKNNLGKMDNSTLSKLKLNAICAFENITQISLNNFYKKSLHFCRN